jgi:hypothetical protein
MTPTLYGRWQTRFLLLSTIGLAVTLLFGHLFTQPDYMTPVILLGYVLGFGLGWDWFYMYLQSYRWDRDWPPLFQLAAGLWEAVFLWGCIQLFWIWQPFGLTQLPGAAPGLTFSTFLLHYASIWIAVFLASQGLVRVIFPRWRFHGGEWL